MITDNSTLFRALIPLRASEVGREGQFDLLEPSGELAIKRKKAEGHESLDLGGNRFAMLFRESQSTIRPATRSWVRIGTTSDGDQRDRPRMIAFDVLLSVASPIPADMIHLTA